MDINQPKTNPNECSKCFCFWPMVRFYFAKQESIDDNNRRDEKEILLESILAWVMSIRFSAKGILWDGCIETKGKHQRSDATKEKGGHRIDVHRTQIWHTHTHNDKAIKENIKRKWWDCLIRNLGSIAFLCTANLVNFSFFSSSH